MRNWLKNNKGFTLVEMMIVLLIISVLILITIPNVTKHTATIDSKGCEAFLTMVEGQVQAYHMEHKEYPSLEELSSAEYIGTDASCPNGDSISVDKTTGIVTLDTSS